ncbi:MAG: hypothetical protein HW421_3367 [Ignavibacteria bacterium]|nr:hypothetical protein [Ignavibacteria bacterium]
MKYLIIFILAISLFYSCSKDNSVYSGTATVKIHIYFAAQTPGFSQYNLDGEGTYIITKGKTYTDSISVGKPQKWTIKVIYYNNLTDNKISIYGNDRDGQASGIEIQNNIFTCKGFDSYIGSGTVIGYVEEIN